MYSEHRVEQVCQTDTMRLRNKSKQMPVAVEAPRASVLNDLQARFVMAIKQLIGNTARWPLVGQLKRFGAKPLHADHRHDLVGENASDCGGGLEVFEAGHVFHGRIQLLFHCENVTSARAHLGNVSARSNLITIMWSLITINPHLTNTIHFRISYEAHDRELPESLV